MIPGQNLLNMAERIISTQGIVYYHALGRTQNSIGQDVTEYKEGIVIYGSFQPVPRQIYMTNGLDLNKNYYTFYTTNNLLDVGRNVSGDQISFNGQRFQCESSNDWYQIDGWKGIICVWIGIDNYNKNLYGFNNKSKENTYQNFGNGNLIGNAL